MHVTGQVAVRGLSIEYDSFGSLEPPVVLLIMGFAAPLTRWPRELIDELVARGYRVVRFDNRDVGLSTKLDPLGPRSMAELVAAASRGEAMQAPYSLDDMAADAVGVLDALQIERAHVVGASMGGMIAQLVALNHPKRVSSLTSIMSTTGNPALPAARPEIMSELIAMPPDASDLEPIIARRLRLARMIGSSAYPESEATIRTNVTRETLRGYSPSGAARQLAAVMTSGDRGSRLRTLSIPAVVLHGAEDTLVPLEAGKDTAANIPGADLRIIAGMGHDFPPALMGVFADAICTAAARSQYKASA
jgi:pimeloyl-ACP methyl ester carboxylesterase